MFSLQVFVSEEISVFRNSRADTERNTFGRTVKQNKIVMGTPIFYNLCIGMCTNNKGILPKYSTDKQNNIIKPLLYQRM